MLDSSWVHYKCRENMQLLPVCDKSTRAHCGLCMDSSCLHASRWFHSLHRIYYACIVDTTAYVVYPGIGPSELHTHTDGGRWIAILIVDTKEETDVHIINTSRNSTELLEAGICPSHPPWELHGALNWLKRCACRSTCGFWSSCHHQIVLHNNFYSRSRDKNSHPTVRVHNRSASTIQFQKSRHFL